VLIKDYDDGITLVGVCVSA